MDSHVNYTAVGAFVIGLFALAIFAVIWLSAGLSINEFSTYKVYMKESVTGLSIDAPVEYNGVNVGTVSSIKIDRQNLHQVELLLKIKSDTPITQGTRAKLNVKVITGIAYLLLEDKGTDMRSLEIQSNELYPVIPTTPSLLLQLDVAITELNTNFRQLSASVKSLLSEENLRYLRGLLQSTQSAMETINAQTIPAFNQTVTSLGSLSHDLSEISAEIKQNPAVLVRGKSEPSLGPGEK